MEDDKIYDLIIQGIKGIKEDVKGLDSKIDQIQTVQAQDSFVLKEHERRSTASERRIEALENFKQQQDISNAKFKGFVIYGGFILAFIAASATFFRDVVEGWFAFFHR